MSMSLCSVCSSASRHAALWFVVALASAGCGSHKSVDESTAGKGGSAAVSGGSSSGNAGNGGSGGAAGGGITCGTMQCSSVGNALISGFGGPMPVACCVPNMENTCGIAMSASGTCEQRAVPDARCPNVDAGALGALGGVSMGCCTADNRCGVDGALFGRGCVENSEAAQMLSMVAIIGTSVKVPAPQSCDGQSDAGL